MAKVKKEFGVNANFYFEGKLVGCAETIEITITVDEIGNKCQGNVGINTKRPGDVSFTWSANGVDVYIDGAELTTDVSGDQFWSLADAGTEIDVIYGGPAAGNPIKTCVGYLNKVTQSNQRGEEAKYDIAGWFNSVTPGTRPA